MGQVCKLSLFDSISDSGPCYENVSSTGGWWYLQGPSLLENLSSLEHTQCGLRRRVTLSVYSRDGNVCVLGVSISIVEGSCKAGKVLVDSEELAETLRRGEILELR